MQSRYSILAVVLTIAAGARAGLHDPEKPEAALTALPHELFRDRWSDVVLIGQTNPETKYRRDALSARDALLKIKNPTPAELLRLGILRLRLRETEAAFADLQQACGRNPRDFYALTALGTAYQQTGQDADAERYLGAARDVLPELGDLAKLEAAQLKLARLRLRERAGRRGRQPPPEDVDALFDVRFVGRSGEYEAGALADDQRAKLPPDAVAIVQQLLMSLPDDSRLYWLLAELYNAGGDLDSALAVLNECLDSRRFDAPALRRHRQVIKDALDARAAATNALPPRVVLAIGAGGLAGSLLLFWQLRVWVRQLLRRSR